LTIEASGRPGMVKFIRPAMKSSLRMSWVVARKLAVLTTAPEPNSTPLGLIRNTRPLALIVPLISEGPSPPVTRLSTTEDEFG
jgi:hypothetical protein